MQARFKVKIITLQTQIVILSFKAKCLTIDHLTFLLFECFSHSHVKEKYLTETFNNNIVDPICIAIILSNSCVI